MELFMIVMTKTMNMKIHSLLRIITYLGLITALQMLLPQYYALSPRINGLKYGWKKNITTIQLRKVDPKQIKSLSEISRILLVIETYLLFMWIQQRLHSKLPFVKPIYQRSTPTTTFYWELRYVLSLLAVKMW